MCCISATTMQRKISCLKQSKAEVAARLTLDDFPRSVRYDPLWLAEALSQVMQFEPNTRLMGLGCGKALTSIFLAADTGRTLSFTRLMARRKEVQAVQKGD